MNTFSLIIDNFVPIILTSTVICIFIYYFEKKNNGYDDKQVKELKKGIKERNWTYLGRVEFLSFFPKPIIIIGIIFFWGTFFIMLYNMFS